MFKKIIDLIQEKLTSIQHILLWIISCWFAYRLIRMGIPKKMKRKILFLVCSIITSAVVGQTSGDFYTIDKQHSLLTFKVRHIGFGSIIGTFENYEGTIYFDPSDISATSVSLVAEVNSIKTGAAGRDRILKNEFFQVDLYPFVKFESVSTRYADQQYFLIGDLTMGAETQRVEIPFEHISGPAKDQFRHSRITLGGRLKVNRREFGLFYRSNEFWDNIIEDEVKIEIEAGAKVYNSLETIFPFRENNIGRLAFDAYEQGGHSSAEQKIEEVLADPNFITRSSHMLRGVTHLAQSGNTTGAIELIDIFLDTSPEIDGELKAEFIARKAKYYLMMGKSKLAAEYSERALSLYPNTLALEVLKRSQ